NVTPGVGNTLNGILFNESGIVIGGLGAGDGNVIAGNGLNGVVVQGGQANRITGNRIYANGGLGIDLGASGPDANDIGDGDGGANTSLNAPVLYAAVSAPDSTTANGLFNSAANQSYTVTFYASPQCAASGFGEGQVYLGSVAATTDASGNGGFGATLPVTLAGGQVVTALLTDATSNTSEFSACTIAQPDNTSWDRALPLSLQGGAGELS